MLGYKLTKFSSIYGMVNFWMSSFDLLECYLRDIKKLCKYFLWTGDLTKRTVANVSWAKLCIPKIEGELGLRNFMVWNKCWIWGWLCSRIVFFFGLLCLRNNTLRKQIIGQLRSKHQVAFVNSLSCLGQW